MHSISQIAEGFVNNILKKEEDLFNTRITICRSCKLHKIDKVFGEVCNKSLWLNPETNEISNSPKIKYVHGCGCVLKSKTRVPNAHCPLDK